MIDLAKKLISIIQPKCFNCNNTATREINYDVILGKSYCCDDCKETHMSGKQPHYTDLDCAESIRAINGNKEIDLSVIFKLLYCVYPKCNVCNRTATKSSHCKSFLTDWINFCDNHTHLDMPMYKNIEFTYKNLENACIIREAEKYLEEKINEG